MRSRVHEIEEVENAYAGPEATELRERILIAPRSGRFMPNPPETFTTEGEWVDVGQTVAIIRSGDRAAPVVSGFSGWVMGMLAVPGQPVAAGDPLFWLRT